MTDPPVPAQQASALIATISAGQSLSNAIDCTTAVTTLARIYMPDDWNEAVITFELSTDNIEAYRPLYNFDGKLGQMIVLPKAAVLVPDSIGKGLAWIKIRSGTWERPVVQKADRVFKLIMI